jgi:hypothetical protein
MKHQMRAPSVMYLIVILNSCGIGGFWLNGNPFPTPIKPYIEYWDKPGMLPTVRGHDSARCGGGDSDYAPGFGPQKIKAAQRSNEKENETRSRLFDEWERCMINIGYRYTGRCYDNETSKTSPACGAP